MTVTIGPATKEIIAHHAKLYITVGGTRRFFAATKNVRIKYEFAPIEEAVCGSQFKRVLTGSYSGDFEPEWIYTTDTLLNLNSPDPTTHEVPVCTIELEGKDVVSPQNVRWITVTAKVFTSEVQGQPQGEGVLKVRATGRLTAYPEFTTS